MKDNSKGGKKRSIMPHGKKKRELLNIRGKDRRRELL